MENEYWRVTYNEIGVYEGLKRKIWDNNDSFSEEDWKDFKKSKDVN